MPGAEAGSHPWRVWECHQALLQPPKVRFTSTGALRCAVRSARACVEAQRCDVHGCAPLSTAVHWVCPGAWAQVPTGAQVCPALPCCALSCHTVLCHHAAMPHCAVSCCASSHYVMPSHTILYHAIPFHTVPLSTVPLCQAVPASWIVAPQAGARATWALLNPLRWFSWCHPR